MLHPSYVHTAAYTHSCYAQQVDQPLHAHQVDQPLHAQQLDLPLYAQKVDQPLLEQQVDQPLREQQADQHEAEVDFPCFSLQESDFIIKKLNIFVSFIIFEIIIVLPNSQKRLRLMMIMHFLSIDYTCDLTRISPRIPDLFHYLFVQYFSL